LSIASGIEILTAQAERDYLEFFLENVLKFRHFDDYFFSHLDHLAPYFPKKKG
jgi:hypothetical protein